MTTNEALGLVVAVSLTALAVIFVASFIAGPTGARVAATFEVAAAAVFLFAHRERR